MKFPASAGSVDRRLCSVLPVDLCVQFPAQEELGHDCLSLGGISTNNTAKTINTTQLHDTGTMTRRWCHISIVIIQMMHGSECDTQI